MAEEKHVEKTCSDCKCRDCNPITRMAERVDAWTSARSLLVTLKYDNDVAGPTPMEVGTLASWLYEGAEGD
jgi:hypothetical protein